MRGGSKMTRLFKGALLLIITVLLISGCSTDIKEEYQATNNTVAKTFKTTPKKTNNENKDIRFYLPFGFEIKEQSPNNILLKNGAKTYILFYNPQEDQESQVVYKAAINNEGKFQFAENYKQDNRFGYLLINDIEKNLHVVTIGIGGVKITTETKTKSMDTEAKMMMEIVNSVKINEKVGKQ